MRKLIVLLILLSTASAKAGGIAVNSGGSVLISGEKKVIYQHDPNSLKVIKTMPVKTKTTFKWDFIKQLELNSKGDLIFCVTGMSKNRFTVLKTASGKVVRTIEDVYSMGCFGNNFLSFVCAQSASLLVYRNINGFNVMDMQTGKDIRIIDVVKAKTRSVALSSDGKILAVVTKSSENEEKVAPVKNSHTTEDHTFNEKHDGKGCKIIRYDVTNGKFISQTPIWYSGGTKFFSGICTFFYGKDLIIVDNSVHSNALISPGNKTSIFSCMRIDYGVASSRDGAKFASGSFLKERHGHIVDMKTPSKLNPIKNVKSTGDSEYYSNMTFDEKGNLYGLTTKLRIFRVNDKFEMDKIEPIKVVTRKQP